MTWVRIDDALPEQAGWDIAGAAGLGLHVAALAYCNRNLTDGLLTLARVRRLIECPDVDGVIGRLVDAGFWRLVPDDCVELVDFLEHQPSAEKVQADRQAKAARQARWVERQKATRDASQGASADVPPTRPRPAPKGEGRGRNVAHRSSGAARPPFADMRIVLEPLPPELLEDSA